MIYVNIGGIKIKRKPFVYQAVGRGNKKLFTHRSNPIQSYKKFKPYYSDVPFLMNEDSNIDIGVEPITFSLTKKEDKKAKYIKKSTIINKNQQNISTNLKTMDIIVESVNESNSNQSNLNHLNTNVCIADQCKVNSYSNYNIDYHSAPINNNCHNTSVKSIYNHNNPENAQQKKNTHDNTFQNDQLNQNQFLLSTNAFISKQISLQNDSITTSLTQLQTTKNDITYAKFPNQNEKSNLINHQFNINKNNEDLNNISTNSNKQTLMSNQYLAKNHSYNKMIIKNCNSTFSKTGAFDTFLDDSTDSINHLKSINSITIQENNVKPLEHNSYIHQPDYNPFNKIDTSKLVPIPNFKLPIPTYTDIIPNVELELPQVKMHQNNLPLTTQNVRKPRTIPTEEKAEKKKPTHEIPIINTKALTVQPIATFGNSILSKININPANDSSNENKSIVSFGEDLWRTKEKNIMTTYQVINLHILFSINYYYY